MFWIYAWLKAVSKLELTLPAQVHAYSKKNHQVQQSVRTSTSPHPKFSQLQLSQLSPLHLLTHHPVCLVLQKQLNPKKMVTTRSNRRPTSQPAQHERGTTSARGRGRRGRGGAQQVHSTRNQNSNQQSTGDHHERSDDGPPPDDDESEDLEAEIGFTLENFESHLDSWTLPLLRQVLNKRKKNSNRIPPEVQEALNFHKTNYVKIKLMLAILGRVSEKTINGWL
jgi:hypothetical protein